MAEDNSLEQTLFDHLKKLWDNGKDIKTAAETNYNYLLGKNANGEKNNCNAIKPICKAKLTAVLDSQMIPSVVPVISAFQDLDGINDARDVADVLNDALNHVLRKNKWASKRQEVCEWAEVVGGFMEQTFDVDKNEIVYTILDPRKCRWSKGTKTIDDCAAFGIEFEMPVSEMKEKFAIKEDDTIDDDMSAKIEKLAGNPTNKPEQSNKPAGVVAYTSNAGAGQAYANQQGGKTLGGADVVGQTVTLVKIYIKDKSLIPNTQDDTETTEDLNFLRYAFPNGRCLVFCPKDTDKTIWEDIPLKEEFGFPIDVLPWEKTQDLEGQGEVEDLIFLQDRLSAAYARLRVLIAKYVSIICYDASQVDIKEDDFVDVFAMKLDNLKNGMPQILTNNTLSELENLFKYIDALKQEMKETARVNDTMISGLRQPGTNSGEQVEALKEDPQSSIRAIQRNLQEFVISVGNKTLELIKNNYDYNRLISLTTGIDVKNETNTTTAKYAQMNSGDEGQTMSLLDEAGNIIKEIQLGDMQFEVEITAGTEIPRSRGEKAQLYTELAKQGLLGDVVNDLDAREELFEGLDVPNRRGLINAARKKQEQSQGKGPSLPNAKDLTVAFKDLPLPAQQYWLEQNGFPKNIVESIAPSQAAPINNNGALVAGQQVQ